MVYIFSQSIYVTSTYIHIMTNKDIKQKPTQINKSTYQEIFSIIQLLSKEYIFPNMPKKYRFKHLFTEIEIGEIYKRGDVFPQRLYFEPDGFFDHSFISMDVMMSCIPYNLEEILDCLDTPHQILCRFYSRLIQFSKGRKKKINGLRLALHFMKVILEKEKEYVA
jgi:hypothetical protein